LRSEAEAVSENFWMLANAPSVNVRNAAVGEARVNVRALVGSTKRLNSVS
jgi:hypothetical protein